MKLLYISHLSSGVSAGLNWSVPASVKAQEQIDDVLWIDMTPGAYQKHWSECKSYHNIREFDKIDFSNLPILGGRPDVVIFEGFYFFQDVRMSWKLQTMNIPYIIIPRSGLTKQGQNNHSRWKKKIANFLFFNRFVKKSLAIQFLTEDERKDSLDIYKQSFVIPNGFNTPPVQKQSFSLNGIKAVFIGRLDIHQKGLDILLEACIKLQDELRDNNFTIDVYGPRRLDYHRIVDYVKNHAIEDIVICRDVISGEEKEKTLLDSDLFVMTSRYEGHPMGLIEALAYGLPVFITRGTNMKSEVEEYDAGWTCETEQNQVISSLRELLSQKNELKAKGENARTLSLRYDWNILATSLHNTISNLLSLKIN